MTTGAEPDGPGGGWDATAVDVLCRNADHASAFLAMNDATPHFRVDGVDGFIAYGLAGRRYAVTLCGPFARPADRPRLLAAFRDWAARHGRRVAAIQLAAPDARMYAEHGFTVNQIGSGYGVRLSGYDFRGGDFVKIRNKIAKARRAGVDVREAERDGCDERLAADLDRVDRGWLRAKGRHAVELDFLIGQRGGRGSAHRRLFVASAGGQMIAYLSCSPVFGSRPGWLYDLSRRLPDVPPGVVEAMISTAVRAFQADGAGWLHFGMTPFAGLHPDHELAEANRRVSRLVRLLAEHGRAVYPTTSQAAFKLKWRPDAVDPEYVAFDQKSTPAVLWSVVRMAWLASTATRHPAANR
jgi:lysylphosphatidylglycerol synthetase-like protein (DUF2156 family)